MHVRVPGNCSIEIKVTFIISPSFSFPSPMPSSSQIRLQLYG